MQYKANSAVAITAIIIVFLPIVQSVPFDQKSNNVNQTIENITQNYVDTNISNVDFTEGKGTHSDFSAQQFGPDTVYDVLSEESSSIMNTIVLYVNSYNQFSSDWTRVGGSPYLDVVDYNLNYIHAKKNNYEIGNFGFEDSEILEGLIQSVTLEIYAKQTQINNHLEVNIWDGESWTNSITIHDPQPQWSWIYSNLTSELDSWNKIDQLEISLKTTTWCIRIFISFEN